LNQAVHHRVLFFWIATYSNTDDWDIHITAVKPCN
jgi:hypothetical protein